MTSQVTSRIDAALCEHVVPVPKRLRALRLYLGAVTLLFLLVTVICACTGAWLAALLYAMVTSGGVFLLGRCRMASR